MTGPTAITIVLEAKSLRQALVEVSRNGPVAMKLRVIGGQQAGELWIERQQILFAFFEPGDSVGTTAFANILSVPNPRFEVSFCPMLPLGSQQRLNLQLSELLPTEKLALPQYPGEYQQSAPVTDSNYLEPISPARYVPYLLNAVRPRADTFWTHDVNESACPNVAAQMTSSRRTDAASLDAGQFSAQCLRLQRLQCEIETVGSVRNRGCCPIWRPSPDSASESSDSARRLRAAVNRQQRESLVLKPTCALAILTIIIFGLSIMDSRMQSVVSTSFPIAARPMGKVAAAQQIPFTMPPAANEAPSSVLESYVCKFYPAIRIAQNQTRSKSCCPQSTNRY